MRCAGGSVRLTVSTSLRRRLDPVRASCRL